jgi:hypothetical protein
MPKSLDRIQPVMGFLPTNRQNWLLAAMHPILPLWMRWQCGVLQVETRHIERLVELNQKFEAGKVRYLLAFRHPTIDDQFSMFHLLSYDLPRAAAKMGVKFEKAPSSYFVYDRGIPLWAGEIVTWLYPRTGGIPIYRGKADRQGLQAIRQFMINGEYPVAISPEGGTNGHSELVNPVEPGVAQMGFWGMEDLVKAGRTEQIVILPVGVQYHYIGDNWARIDDLLMRLERDCGLSKPKIEPSDRYKRLYDLGDHILNFVNNHYKKFYASIAPSPPADESLGAKLQVLLDHILRVAESHFDIKSKGSFIDRSRRLEQAGWDQVFRSDIKDIDALSVMEIGFANQLAKEANTSHWHMRIAESLTAVTGDYVARHPSPTRFAETLLLIDRALSRTKSEPFGKNPYLGDRKVVLSIGEPLSVSDRFAEYQSSRTAAKQCVNQLTTDLQSAMESLIEPS